MKKSTISALTLPAVGILFVIANTGWLLHQHPFFLDPVVHSSANEGFEIPVTPLAKRRLPPFFQSTTIGNHTRTDQRVVLSFTVVPTEIQVLAKLLKTLLHHSHYDIFDAIHVCVPWLPMRRSQDAAYDQTEGLLKTFPSSHRIILHRLPDFGPMTRYIGPVQYELNPHTRIVVFDIDADSMDYNYPQDEIDAGYVTNTARQIDNVRLLVTASLQVDPSAVWCNYGEDFAYYQGKSSNVWGTNQGVFEKNGTLKWKPVHICRGVKGLLVQPRFFLDFWYNQTDYHESCFWDDDRWTSFQFERMNISRYEVKPMAWMGVHQPHRKRPLLADVVNETEDNGGLNHHSPASSSTRRDQPRSKRKHTVFTKPKSKIKQSLIRAIHNATVPPPNSKLTQVRHETNEGHPFQLKPPVQHHIEVPQPSPHAQRNETLNPMLNATHDQHNYKQIETELQVPQHRTTQRSPNHDGAPGNQTLESLPQLIPVQVQMKGNGTRRPHQNETMIGPTNQSLGFSPSPKQIRFVHVPDGTQDPHQTVERNQLHKRSNESIPPPTLKRVLSNLNSKARVERDDPKPQQSLTIIGRNQSLTNQNDTAVAPPQRLELKHVQHKSQDQENVPHVLQQDSTPKNLTHEKNATSDPKDPTHIVVQDELHPQPRLKSEVRVNKDTIDSGRSEAQVWPDRSWNETLLEPIHQLHTPNDGDGNHTLRRRLGTLSSMNDALESAQTCTKSWMERHPNAFPEPRVILA